MWVGVTQHLGEDPNHQEPQSSDSASLNHRPLSAYCHQLSFAPHSVSVEKEVLGLGPLKKQELRKYHWYYILVSVGKKLLKKNGNPTPYYTGKSTGFGAT